MSSMVGRPLIPKTDRYFVTACFFLAGGVTVSLAWLWYGSPTLLQGLLLSLLLAPALVDLLRGTFDLFELRNLFCLGYFTQFVLSAWYSQVIEYRYVSKP